MYVLVAIVTRCSGAIRLVDIRNIVAWVESAISMLVMEGLGREGVALWSNLPSSGDLLTWEITGLNSQTTFLPRLAVPPTQLG